MIYLLSILLFVPTIASANVYIITDQSGSVYTASEKDDTVVPQGYTKTVIKGKLTELDVSRPVTDYKYSGKKFTIDTDKVKAKEADDAAKQEKADAKASAINKLKATGLTEAEIQALLGQ